VNGRILIVDDDTALCELLAEGLAPHGFDCTWLTSSAAALARMQSEEFDVLVSDINLPAMNGLELCARIGENRPDLPVIVITAFGNFDTAVAAIRAGAYDFITKPFDVDVVALSLGRAVRHRRLREEVRRLRQAVSGLQGFEEVVGSSPAMGAVYDLLARLADSEATVLVTGESGTGKEIVARALHRRSRRKQGPFVAVNCAAMPEALLESELFGHVKGAFTDARASRLGLLAQSNGGTLFLDEIGDMPLALQPKILRALEDRVIRPVGGEQEVRFDARIVTASHRDLETLVEEGRFREDLYYRINVVHVALPALRARGGDILQLAQVFLERFATQSAKQVRSISSAAAEKLLVYPWPGNVRELRNTMERAVALTRYETIAVEDLPDKIKHYQGSHVIVASDDPSELVPLEEVERRYILRVMEAVSGNKTLASRVLALDRKTLYRKLEQFAGKTGASRPS
jgi:two-component system response regulator AtoC